MRRSLNKRHTQPMIFTKASITGKHGKNVKRKLTVITVRIGLSGIKETQARLNVPRNRAIAPGQSGTEVNYIYHNWCICSVFTQTVGEISSNMARMLLVLLAAALTIGASAHSCPPPPNHTGGNTEYSHGTIVAVACPSGPGYNIKCTEEGSWLSEGSCSDGAVVNTEPQAPSQSMPMPPQNSMLNHYHPAGSPMQHNADTVPHYHPESVQQPSPPMAMQPLPPIAMKPLPPVPATTTTTPPPTTTIVPQYCHPVQGLELLPQSHYPPGFVVIGVPCPYVPGMYNMYCDEAGSGQWLIERDACGGVLTQPPPQQPGPYYGQPIAGQFQQPTQYQQQPVQYQQQPVQYQQQPVLYQQQPVQYQTQQHTHPHPPAQLG